MQTKASDAHKITPAFLQREKKLIQLLAAFLSAGLAFMLIPGTLIGVFNLFTISGQHSSAAATPGWVDAHGHAQLFGWIGTFILGIGYYTLPNLRKTADASFLTGWTIFTLWVTGVGLHWASVFFQWQMQVLVPLSAVLETAAVILFLSASYTGHRNQPRTGRRIEAAAVSVILGTLGLLATTLVLLWQSIIYHGNIPDFGRLLYITTAVWAFIVPVATGLSAKWLPAFMSIPAYSERGLYAATALAFSGCTTHLLQAHFATSILLFAYTVSCIWSLNVWRAPLAKPKTTGIHPSTPTFVRIAYGWLLIATMLGLGAVLLPQLTGLAGASRHAVTVGFMSTLVFCIGPRMLPAFLGRASIYSSRLMFVALVLLTAGCAMRVASQSLAYGTGGAAAWALLPVSATIELSAFIVFTFNMAMTLKQPPLLEQFGTKA